MSKETLSLATRYAGNSSVVGNADSAGRNAAGDGSRSERVRTG
ncbi:hypothetical protein [Enterobacter cloacae complex sp. 288G10]